MTPTTTCPDAATLPGALREHTEVCEEIYELMLDENRLLKSVGGHPDERILKRKRALLAALTPALAQLREAGAKREGVSPEVRGKMEKAQQTILKALLLDRENEQLLLKSPLSTRPANAAPRPAAAQLQRAYEKFR